MVRQYYTDFFDKSSVEDDQIKTLLKDFYTSYCFASL